MERIYRNGNSKIQVTKTTDSMVLDITETEDNGDVYQAKIHIKKEGLREFIGELLHVQAGLFKKN